MHVFELAVDPALPAEGPRAARARACRSRGEPEGQGGLRQGQGQGQEDSGREQQAAEQQAGSQRAGPVRVCGAGGGRGHGPGQHAAEWGPAPEET